MQRAPRASRLEGAGAARPASAAARPRRPSAAAQAPRPRSPAPLAAAGPAIRPPGPPARAAPAAPRAAAAGGDGGSTGGSGGGSGGSGGGGSGGSGGEGEEEEFLDLAAAEELAAARGVALPPDWAALAATAAAGGGLRASALAGYLSAMTGGGALTRALLARVPAFRDRLLMDKLFLFKVLAEMGIDSACATVAEVRKRGDDFWAEFEFYLSDMAVGLVMDVVLVTLLAPALVAGRAPPAPANLFARWASRFPSAVFAATPGGRKAYSLAERAGCYAARGLEYAAAGLACGVVGQGAASGLMVAKRAQQGGARAGDVEVPPVLQTGLVWGAFMGLSANTRYQLVFGLERLVDETVARRVPGIAYLTTTALRFANNVVGGEQFIDMARWAGVQ